MKSTSAQSSNPSAWSTWPSHPPELRPLRIPPRLRIPLSAGDSAEIPFAKPAGTHVSAGNPLTVKPVGSIHSPIAPVPGTILGTSRAQLLNGRCVPVVDFQPDPTALPPQPSPPDKPRPVAGLWENLEYSHLPAWIDRLHGAGIWADRHTSPNLTAQFNQALHRPIDTVICSALDSDASTRLNSTLASHFATDVAAAVMLLSKLTHAQRRWIIVESGAPPRWWKHLRHWARRLRINLILLPNDYPQADPTLLLYTLLNRRLLPGQSPVDHRVLLADAAAMIAVGDWVLSQRPMLHVPLSIYDHARRHAHSLLAPLGMPLRDALDQIDITINDSTVLRSGDLLRDRRIDADAVIAGGELIVHAMGRQEDINPDPCIRCGWCVEACPSRAQPAGLLEASQRNDLTLARHHGLHACIECGICSYVCPSRLPLLDGIRKLRNPVPMHCS